MHVYMYIYIYIYIYIYTYICVEGGLTLHITRHQRSTIISVYIYSSACM